MIATHALSGCAGLAAPARGRLGDQARLPEEFVALQHQIGLPGASLQAEGDRATLPALGVVRHPVAQQATHVVRGRGRTAILPGQQRVPAAPASERGGQGRRAGQAEVGHRDGAPGDAAAVAIGEGVELFQETQLQAGLLLDPGPDGGLQRPVAGEQRTRGQPRLVADGEDDGLAVGQRHDHGQDLGGGRFAAHRYSRDEVGMSRQDTDLGPASGRSLGRRGLQVIPGALYVIPGLPRDLGSRASGARSRRSPG